MVRSSSGKSTLDFVTTGSVYPFWLGQLNSTNWYSSPNILLFKRQHGIHASSLVKLGLRVEADIETVS